VSRVVWSKKGEIQWVEETEPSLAPCARPLAWFRRNAPTSLVTRDDHVIPFGRMQRAHLRARCVRINPLVKGGAPVSTSARTLKTHDAEVRERFQARVRAKSQVLRCNCGERTETPRI
jgi:hypothetical protein